MSNGPCPAWLALWNDVAPGYDDEYNAWHGEEHVPQRLTVPGILGALRYRAQYENQTRYLTWYALAGLHVLSSAPYQQLLAQPTPWSRRMRPHLRNLRRHACVTRLASVARPSARVRAVLIAAGQDEPATRHADQLPLLLGEVDRHVAPLPWATAAVPAPEADVRWVRIENLHDPLPGTYTLIQDLY